MNTLTPYTVQPKEKNISIKLKKELIKKIKKQDITNQKSIIHSINDYYSFKLSHPVTEEQVDNLNQEQLIQILILLDSLLPEVELYKWSKTLFEQSRSASNKFQKLKQYNKLQSEYAVELSVSNAFYHDVLDSLVIAVFILIQKIYEKSESSNSISVKTFLNKCKNNIQIFPKYQVEFDDSINPIDNIPWKWEISSQEILFFKEHYPSLFKYDFDMVVSITPEILISLHEWKYDEFKKKNKLKHLYIQRDKIYVHNDKTSLKSTDKVATNNPLSFEDLENFIQYSLKFSQMIFLMLTGTYKEINSTDCDDWEDTLQYVRGGLKQKEIEIQEQIKKVEKLFEIQNSLHNDK